MTEKETIKLLIDGGKASPGPATAPKLSAYKLNINEIFKEINDKTKEYAGIKVPVKIVIDKNTKEYEILIGIPPVSSLIKKELGIEKAKITEEDKTAGKTSLGNLSMEQCVKIAKLKIDELLAKDFKSAVKQVVGVAVSMPITIEDKQPKEVIKEIDDGKWDNLFKV